jgi:hypothetical protein
MRMTYAARLGFFFFSMSDAGLAKTIPSSAPTVRLGDRILSTQAPVVVRARLAWEAQARGFTSVALMMIVRVPGHPEADRIDVEIKGHTRPEPNLLPGVSSKR